MRAYFDGPISDDDAESMSCVETEMLADCFEGESLTLTCIRLDTPQPINDAGFLVFHRREPNID